MFWCRPGTNDRRFIAMIAARRRAIALLQKLLPRRVTGFAPLAERADSELVTEGIHAQ